MLHDVVQRKKFYTLVLQKCLTRSLDLDQFNFVQSIVLYNQDKEKIKQERRKKICQDN